jgi:23S rRNA (pseudouridine1915-N3)-methyltransferase
VRIVLAVVGRLKAGPERELSARYLERAQAACRQVGLTSIDVREIDESRARRPEDRKIEEAAAITALLARGGRLIVCDERGKSIPSEDFSRDIGIARDAGEASYVLVIGGPDGIAPELRSSASMAIAFGAMTWPHQLVRVMALEQIYRAVTILSGHPYHRV